MIKHKKTKVVNMGKIDGYDEYGRPYEEDEEIPEE